MSPLLFTLVLALAATTDPALRGLDPVELCQGREVPGDAARTLEREGFHYLFASGETRARFESDPARFAIQMGGGCGRMGPLSGRGAADRFVVHDGRIYVFASDGCRAGFLEAPGKHVDRDDPPLEGDARALERGRELLALALRGLGGAERVDAARAVSIVKEGTQESGGRTYRTRTAEIWRFPDDLRTESAWDDKNFVTVATPADAFTGRDEMEPLPGPGRVELRRQMGREALWLLRHRGAQGFEVSSSGAETLLVRF